MGKSNGSGNDGGPEAGTTTREAAAYHEAGHVVAALAHNVEIESATVAPAKNYKGLVELAAPLPSKNAVDYLQLIASDIVITLAGPIAERTFSDAKPPGGGSDFTQVFTLLDHLQPDPGRAEALLMVMALRTLELVERHWDLVTAFARALLKKEILTRDEIVKVAVDAGWKFPPSRNEKGLGPCPPDSWRDPPNESSANALKAVMAREPHLIEDGIFDPDEYRRAEWFTFDRPQGGTAKERMQRLADEHAFAMKCFQQERDALMKPDSVAAFDHARRWLRKNVRSGAPARTVSSYGLRHLIVSDTGVRGSHGAHIAACLAEGFVIERLDQSAAFIAVPLTKEAWGRYSQLDAWERGEKEG